MKFSEQLEDLYKLQNEYLGQNKLVNHIQPFVSVHVITYQHGKYIRDCLDNILRQKTNFLFEIVIGEDESSDNTRELCKEYAEKNQNIIRLFLRDRKRTVIVENNRTLYLNGKLTLKSCRGKYIALCEGDDYWTDPYKLQKQIDFLENNPEYNLCFHNSLIKFEGNSKKSRPFNKNLNKKMFTTSDIIQMQWFVPTESIVFRNNIEFPEWSKMVIQGDRILLLMNSIKGNLFYLDEIMSVRRVVNSGLSKTLNRLSIVQSSIALFYYFNQQTDFKFHDIIEQKVKNELSGIFKLMLLKQPIWIRLLDIHFYMKMIKALYKRFWNFIKSTVTS